MYIPGYTSQQLLDPFSSDSVVQQKCRCFRDFTGAQKIENLSESKKPFRKSISNNK